MDIRPIGVFDSGVGGLTVLKRLKELLPNEDYIYFGDTKRVPYGEKSKKEIEKYARQIVHFMNEKNTKIIVIACNTTCASIDKNEYSEILFNVLEAGAESAAYLTKNKKVGVIATTRTIESRSYEKNIKLIDSGIDVFGKACPRFVPLVEEGLANSDEAFKCAKEYLSVLNNEEIDTLVLGCTHYPILINAIKNAVHKDVIIVDPAIKLSEKVKSYLEENAMLNSRHTGKTEYFVSGNKENFVNTAKLILNEDIEKISIVDIERY
ncbi:glutamate racemase [Thermoanaerobacterium thermosaccharolyticum]|uniref:Glutamate racemase n=1 Tax=Thermoanaerobacterium thermosaccharolyticum TaxID=1517 RepID=A0A231VKP8_THETR|nr:glutamate racemase [Thermoanaerobacterium thermosaccharolyticum]OXT08825.1 glutamate racemase [Thermoanaerobacterium thermosaccharolyticum]